jgi:hypothetical protein
VATPLVTAVVSVVSVPSNAQVEFTNDWPAIVIDPLPISVSDASAVNRFAVTDEAEMPVKVKLTLLRVPDS